MAERLTKKQLKQDQFLQSIYLVWTYARENPVVTTLGVVGLVAVVTVGVRIGGAASGGGGDSDAERALAAARTEFVVGRLDSGREALEEVRRRHGRTRAGREATFLLGNALYETGDYAGARQAFEAFLEKPLYDDLLRDGARLAIAACKEETGDVAGAAQDYLDVWRTGTHPGTRIASALAAARIARAEGRPDEARQLYRQILDAYPSAPEAEDARFALLQLPQG